MRFLPGHVDKRIRQGFTRGALPVRQCLAVLLPLMLASAIGAPTITSQPSTATVILNESAGSMNVAATSSGGTLHYQWYEGPSGDTSRPIGGDMDTQTAHPTTPISSTDTSYWVRVTDDNGSTDSAAAPVIVIPAAPVEVIATANLFQDRVRVTWNPKSQPHTFDLYRAATNSSAASTLLAASLSAATFDDSTALAGTTYYYFVRAKDAENQESSYSAISSYNDGVRATEPLDGSFIPVREVADYVFSQDSSELFIALKSGFVERYQIAGATISGSYRIGGKIRATDIAPDDAFLLFTTQEVSPEDGIVRKLALPSGQVTAFPYDLEPDESVSYDVSILSDELALVTGTFSGSGSVPLRKLDPQTGVYSLSQEVSQNTFMARTPNGSHAGIFEGSNSDGPWFVYDRQTDSFSTPNELGAFQYHASLNPDGSLIAMKLHDAGIEIFDAAGTLVQSIPGIENAAGNRFLPGLNEFAVVDKEEDSIRFYNTGTWEEIDNMPVGEALGAGFEHFEGGHMEVSPDGNWIALTTALGVRVIEVYHPPVPPAVLDLTATDLTFSDKLYLAWTAAPEATSYEVYRHTENDPDAATALNTGITETQYDDTTAVPFIQYYYWVKAKNRRGSSDFSIPEMGMRQMPVPGSLTATTSSVTTLTISWTFEMLDGDFEIYRSLTSEFADATLLTAVESMARSHVDTTAEVGTVYYYWVRKVSAAGQGNFSGPVLGYLRLATPAGLTATTNLGDRVTINWEPVPGAQHYLVYFKTTQTGFNGTERLVGTTANTTTIDDPYTNLSPGITYYWSVQAVAGINMSAFPNGAAGRRTNIAPQTITATTDLLDRVIVSWSNENDGNTHYRLRRSQSNNPATSVIVQNLTAPTTQWVDTTAVPHVTYYYWVTALTFINPPVESVFSPSAVGRRLGLGFADYQTRYNLSGTNAVLTNDPDDDHYPTILEWGLGGTNPLSQSSAPQTHLRLVTISGETYQAICYLRLLAGTESESGYETPYLRYEAEATPDLVDWTLVPVTATPPSGLPTPPDGYEWGCFRMPGTVAQYPTGFLRLKLSQNTP